MGHRIAGLRIRHLLPWLPTVLGLGFLVVMLTLSLTRLLPTQSQDTPLPPPEPPFLTLPAPSAPPVSVRPAAASATASPSGKSPSPSATTERSASPSQTSTTAAPPSQSGLTGRYRVVDSYADGFIAEVLVVNPSERSLDWTVRLRFAGNVGELKASWVASAPDASVTQDGRTFVWRSVAPVAPKKSAALRVEFARSGFGERPQVCTVNGSTCTGLS